MESVNCPAVLRAMLAKRPDLSSVDGRGCTLMHHAMAADETRDEATRLAREAGVDVEQWRASLIEEFTYPPNLDAILGGPVRPVLAAPPSPTPTSGSATIDWESAGPTSFATKPKRPSSCPVLAPTPALKAISGMAFAARSRNASRWRCRPVRTSVDSAPYNTNREATGNKAVQDALRRRPTPGATPR